MRASSWPDMSPLARDRMSPMEKKLVRTTAVPASEASPRCERCDDDGQHHGRGDGDNRRPPGMIASIPQ